MEKEAYLEMREELIHMHNALIGILEKEFKDLPREEIERIYMLNMKQLGNIANYCPLHLLHIVENYLDNHKNHKNLELVFK